MPKRKVEKGIEAAKRLERHLEEIATNVVTKDTMAHFINAGMEIVQAANVTMKSMEVPDETRNRIHKAERELLLAIRSAIDVVISEIDKEMPKKGSELQRIEIKGARRRAK